MTLVSQAHCEEQSKQSAADSSCTETCKQTPLRRERGPLPPLRPGAAVPGWGRTWSDLAGAPAPAARSPRRYSPLRRASAHTHTLTQTHTLPAGTAWDPQRRARTPSGARTLRTSAARRSIPRPTGRAAPPTFPDGGDAGSVLGVALGGGGRPQQQQQPQREPGPSQRAGGQGAESSEAHLSRGGGIPRTWSNSSQPPSRTSPGPSQPFPPGVSGANRPGEPSPPALRRGNVQDEPGTLVMPDSMETSKNFQDCMLKGLSLNFNMSKYR
uniref:collagen alpha-1(I) chain-like n=1 Tax=Halichoerus grypus TaxID=9711 RepID=UPI001659FB3D|nr:collagen alpha-1(I) chain-like [Halichoerus grypus]